VTTEATEAHHGLCRIFINNIGRIATRTAEHVLIALSALFLALLVAVPLGIL
jgi:ABC-type proline/glycine betaine transport system permease subunit